MPHDVDSLLFALTVSLATIALALPAVMGRVNTAARYAQWAAGLQALGWALLLGSEATPAGSLADRMLSTFAMVGISGGLALNSRAFELWAGLSRHHRAPMLIAVAMPLGYLLGFSNYAFRVGWANGLLALQMGLVAATLWRASPTQVGRWRWLLVVALLAQMTVTAWRGLLGAFDTSSFATFFAPHPVNVAFALVANVTSVLSVVGVLLAHRDEAARALERLATLDGLTGVLNRRAWLVQASTELAISVRYDHPLAVLMIDLDHFKQINDSRGHDAGDRALQFVARALQAAVRSGDLVGRYGGEEFCVLMNHADAAAAGAFDRRMRAYLAEASARELGVTLSYSAGIAMRLPGDDSLAAMLRRADAMLYTAKAQGRARTLDAHGVMVSCN